MKTAIILGLIMLLTLSFHVTKKEKEQVNSGSGRLNDTIYSMPATAIDFNTAKESIKRYVRIAGKLYANDGASQDSIVRAFTIPSLDLLGVLGSTPKSNNITKYNSCRVYLGLDSIPLKNNTYYFKNKLFMVPVNNGLDVNLFYRTITNKDTTYTQFVYDLIAPCPKTCDTLSLLYVR